MVQLAVAIAAPAVGALLYGWLHDHPVTVRLLDSVMYVAVPALVAWQVIPHAWAEFGLLTFLVLAAGMATPNLIERVSRALAPHTDNLAILGGWGCTHFWKAQRSRRMGPALRPRWFFTGYRSAWRSGGYCAPATVSRPERSA